MRQVTARQRTAVGLVVAAVMLGIVGDVLFQGRPLGVNAFLLASAFVAALAVLLRVGRVPLHQGRRVMAAPLLLFTALLAWHDSPLLVAVDLFAIAGAVTLGALRRSDRQVAQAGVADYMIGAASAGASALGGPMQLMQSDLPWEEIGARIRGRRAAAIGRGLAIGLPLLAIFGALFVAADAVFKNLLTTAIPDVRHLWLRLGVVLVIGWLSSGLLRDLLATRENERLLAPAIASLGRPRPRLGATEAAIALGLLNLLFLSFVLVQFRYLFGGRELVQTRLHLTYAEYARHGFFELVTVAILVLPLLLAVDALVRRARPVRLLSGVLIALVFVVMASALQRMRLYQQEYGLTELRIYATGVILWLGCVFVWFAVTVLRGRTRAFAVGAVVAGFVATLALNASNPDALIVRTNLARPHVDAAYLGRLSDDAVPTLLRRLPSLGPNLRRPIASELLRRSENTDGLLGWNASRSRARSLLASHHAELVRFAR
jgi:hypothetical protein